MDYRINLKTINQDLKSRRFWVFGFSVAFLKSKIHSPYGEPKSIIYSKAFTIVELLVVIVVIGILAAITIISYTGITNKAVASAIQSDLSNASTQLKLFQVDNSTFPNSVTDCPNPAVGNLCLKSSPNNTFTYAANNRVSPQLFCLAGTINSTSYKITESSASNSGDCTNYLPVLYLDAGTVASYSGNGVIWNDISGNNYNGTISGATFLSDNGGAFSFDGVNDYINLGDVLDMGTDNFTISVWLKITSTAFGYIISKAAGGGGVGYGIASNPGGTSHVDFYPPGGTRVVASSSVSLHNTGWHNYVGTYNRADKITFYLDAVSRNSVVISDQSQRSLDNGWDFRIGEYGVGGPNNNFGGQISEVRIYKRVLSAVEITLNSRTKRNLTQV